MLAEESARFVTFGVLHQAMLVVFLVGCVPLVWLGRRQRGTGREVRFSRIFAVAIVAFTVPMQVLQFLPAEWNLNTSLPLQICDLAWMVGVYGLWTQRRWAVCANWFWGLTLTVQGMLTPDLVSGWSEPRFWMFWGMHWLIVWSAVYLVWGLRIVPGWREYRTTVVITAAWAVSMMVFNAVVGTNYGYLNAKPQGASILDHLGPWPMYVVLEVLIVAGVWAVMTWLWVRREGRGQDASRPRADAPTGA